MEVTGSDLDAAALPDGRARSAAAVPGARHQRLRFRDFEVLPGERLLLRDGQPLAIGSRAFDLLLVLLRSRGTVVPRGRIFDEVWPATVVAESNLRFQMACLRRVLGDDRDLIKTVQGRGYLLAGEIASSWADVPDAFSAAAGGSSSQVAGHAIVAVIDDDDNTREALEGLLRSVRLPVQAFASVQAFLDAGVRPATGCIVLDVNMPDRSGLEFQSDLIRAGLDLPVVFISGHADIHMSVRAMKAGAVEFLTKPVRHEDLLAAIREALLRPRG